MRIEDSLDVYKGGKEAIAALDINSKEWHIFYLENAIRMKKYDDNGTF